MVVPVFPEGEYDHSHAWNNASDRASWERTFATGADEQRRIAQAMITASPATSVDEIRLKMTMPPPPAPLPAIGSSPTLDAVLSIGPGPNPILDARAPTDFSGSNGSMSSGSVPSLPSW